MQVEIDNSKVYTNPKENCLNCGMKLNLGVVFHNVPANCTERVTYPYMEIDQSMHLECYLEHVIDTILKKKMSRLKNDTDSRNEN